MMIALYVAWVNMLGGSRRDAEAAHGTGGLGDLVLPPPSVPPRAEHGVHPTTDGSPPRKTRCPARPGAAADRRAPIAARCPANVSGPSEHQS